MIFVVALGALGFGALLIMLIARYGSHPQAYPAGVLVAGGQSMPYDDFRALIIDLLEVLKMDITYISGDEHQSEGSHGELMATTARGKFSFPQRRA